MVLFVCSTDWNLFNLNNNKVKKKNMILLTGGGGRDGRAFSN